jgi:tRNA (guanine-N7-)-methyltransferase
MKFLIFAPRMSRINKLYKFAEVQSFPNVYECPDILEPVLLGINREPVDLKGRWNAEHFKNDHPITLELACGGGEYTVGLAKLFPERNFIGVDIKGNRLWKGAKDALDAGLTNAAFIRTRIEIIDRFFAPGEVSEIWITFPDPFPRPSKVNRRLTSPMFHNRYRNMLATGGLVHIKHDDDGFFRFTLKTLAEDPGCRVLYQNDNIYAGPLPFPELAIQTHYEGMHLAKGKTIKYAQYTIS